MAFEITTKGALIYLKIVQYVTKDHAKEIDEIAESISSDKEVKVHVFDLTPLEHFDNRCLRPFVQAQLKARNKEESKVVIIQPVKTSLKKFLLDQAAIRPREICSSLDALSDFLARR